MRLNQPITGYYLPKPNAVLSEGLCHSGSLVSNMYPSISEGECQTSDFLLSWKSQSLLCLWFENVSTLSPLSLNSFGKKEINLVQVLSLLYLLLITLKLYT